MVSHQSFYVPSHSRIPMLGVIPVKGPGCSVRVELKYAADILRSLLRKRQRGDKCWRTTS